MMPAATDTTRPDYRIIIAHMFDKCDGWAHEVWVEPIAAPAPEQIITPGGKTVSVRNPPGTTPAGSQWGVVLAWTRLAGGWGCLLVLDGLRWRTPGGKLDASAWWLWCRYNPVVFVSQKPGKDHLPYGPLWHKRFAGMQFDQAVHEAAGSLPEHLRAVALRPAEAWGGPPQG